MILFMLVDLLFSVFSRSWAIRTRVFRSPFGDHKYYEPEAGVPAGQPFRWSDAIATFTDVELFHVGCPDLAWARNGDHLVLPPGGALRWERSDDTSGVVHLFNAEIEVRMDLAFHGWFSSLGTYAELVDDKQVGNGVDFDFEFRARLARSVSQDVERMYRAWIDSVFELIASNFDCERIGSSRPGMT